MERGKLDVREETVNAKRCTKQSTKKRFSRKRKSRFRGNQYTKKEGLVPTEGKADVVVVGSSSETEKKVTVTEEDILASVSAKKASQCYSEEIKRLRGLSDNGYGCVVRTHWTFFVHWLH